MHAGQGALWPLVIVVLLIAMVCCGAINATIEFVAYRPLRGAPRLAPLITAIGVSFIIEDAGLVWKGPNYVNFPTSCPRRLLDRLRAHRVERRRSWWRSRCRC